MMVSAAFSEKIALARKGCAFCSTFLPVEEAEKLTGNAR
jgi:hypothetical protein